MNTADKARMKKEQERIKKSKAVKLAALEAEDKIQVRFQNIEFPGTALEFTHQSLKGYVLFDGGTYDLPISVVNDLNSLTIPIYKQYDPNEEDQKLKADPTKTEDRIVGSKNRFSLIPVNIAPVKEPEKKAA